MAIVLRGMALAGLIGCGSVFWATGNREPLQPVPASSRSESSSELALHSVQWVPVFPVNGRFEVAIRSTPQWGCYLAVSAREPVRRQINLTVHVEEGGVKKGQPLDWAYSKRDATAPSLCSGLSLSPDDEPCVTFEPTEVSTVHQQWFLPAGNPGDLRSDVLATTEIVQTRRVRVVLDDRVECDEERRRWCQQLAAQLTLALIPRVEAVWGAIADRESQRQLTVVVTPRVRQVTGGDKPVSAFVLASDYRNDLSRPESNECDAIYVSPDLPADSRDAILVHELAHVAQFCAYRRQYGSTPWPLSDWVLEGSAHALEVLLTGNRQNVVDRLQAFATHPERSPLVIVDAARDGRWRDPRCRGAACSFFIWMAQHHGLESLATTSAFTEESTANGVGLNLQELQRDWQIALIANQTVRLQELCPETPTTVVIDGGATAFFALREMNRPVTLTINSQHGDQWDAILVRVPLAPTASAAATAASERLSPLQ